MNAGCRARHHDCNAGLLGQGDGLKLMMTGWCARMAATGPDLDSRQEAGRSQSVELADGLSKPSRGTRLWGRVHGDAAASTRFGGIVRMVGLNA